MYFRSKAASCMFSDSPAPGFKGQTAFPQCAHCIEGTVSGHLLLLLPMLPSTDDGKHVDNVFGSECRPAGMPPTYAANRKAFQTCGHEDPTMWARRQVIQRSWSGTGEMGANMQPADGGAHCVTKFHGHSTARGERMLRPHYGHWAGAWWSKGLVGGGKPAEKTVTGLVLTHPFLVLARCSAVLICSPHGSLSWCSAVLVGLVLLARCSSVLGGATC